MTPRAEEAWEQGQRPHRAQLQGVTEAWELLAYHRWWQRVYSDSLLALTR